MSSLEQLISNAAQRRQATLQSLTQDAWRIVNGPGDGAPPGLVIDRYADWVVVGAREQVAAATAETWAEAAHRALQPAGVVLKTLRRRAAESESRVVHGVLEGPVRVREDDAVFLCDLDDGLPTGLYLDLHDVRRRVRPLASGVSVLNLFSYTGAFSVHAALAGATRVTSVDSSRRAHRRGRENMVASGLKPESHRWFEDDVLDHLARAGRRGDRYGLVVLDPPAFGRAKKKRFVLERSFDTLLDDAVAVVAPSGALCVSVHTAAIDAERLWSGLEAALTRHGRSIRTQDQYGLPEWDHPTAPTDAHDDRGDYLRVLVVRLD